MKTFSEFLAESVTQLNTALVKWNTKIKGGVKFIEDMTDTNGYKGSEFGNAGDKNFCAVIGLKGVDYRDLFALDAHDQKLYGKNVYRYETATTKASKIRPVVKLDLNKGMVYFLSESSIENDGVEFEKTGVKIEFLVVYKKATFLDNIKF